MQVARKVSVLVALGLGFGAAMAGEIAGSTVLSSGAVNSSVGFLASARQNIGVAEQNGKITNSTVIVSGATNTAAGFLSSATQSVGRAPDAGAMLGGGPRSASFGGRGCASPACGLSGR